MSSPGATSCGLKVEDKKSLIFSSSAFPFSNCASTSSSAKQRACHPSLSSFEVSCAAFIGPPTPIDPEAECSIT